MTARRRAGAFAALLGLGLLAACGEFSPLRHRFEPGRDRYLVFVADAPDGRGDLWAMDPDGAEPVQVTFSLPAEFAPALSPEGGLVAFLRARDEADTLHRAVWLVNLVNSAERELPAPKGAGTPLAVAWLEGNRTLAVRTTRGLWRVAAPPAPTDWAPLAGADSAAAGLALAVRVGEPAFARIVPCAGHAADLCAVTPADSVQLLAKDAHDAVHWGADSVGYVQGSELVVRPVGPGQARRVALRPSLVRPRGFTWFPGFRADTAGS